MVLLNYAQKQIFADKFSWSTCSFHQHLTSVKNLKFCGRKFSQPFPDLRNPEKISTSKILGYTVAGKDTTKLSYSPIKWTPYHTRTRTVLHLAVIYFLIRSHMMHVHPGLVHATSTGGTAMAIPHGRTTLCANHICSYSLQLRTWFALSALLTNAQSTIPLNTHIWGWLHPIW